MDNVCGLVKGKVAVAALRAALGNVGAMAGQRRDGSAARVRRECVAAGGAGLHLA